MSVSGYYGKMTVSGDLTPRLIYRFVWMLFCLYIVYGLLVGSAEATRSVSVPVVRGKIDVVHPITVVSWGTYPVVYLFPMSVPAMDCH